MARPKSRNKKINPDGLFGIWWDDGITCVAIYDDDEIGYPGGDLRIDTAMEHAKEWHKIADYFDRSPTDDYRDIPHGRVALHRIWGMGYIYHGPGSTVRIKVIAELFNLVRWEIRTPNRYIVGGPKNRCQIMISAGSLCGLKPNLPTAKKTRGH